MRSSGVAVFASLSLLAPLVVAAVVVVHRADESPLESAAPPEAVVSVVERATRSRDTAVALGIVLADVITPRADASGRVTSVLVEPGTSVTTGTVVVTVGSTDVVAYQAGRPLYEDVAATATGASAVAAQEVLAAMGVYAGPTDGKTRTAWTKAVIAFNVAHGYGRSPVLGLASLLWIGSDPVTVAELVARPGDMIGPGGEIFTTTAGLAGISVAATAAMSVAGASDGMVLEAGGRVVDFPAGTDVVRDAEFTAAVAASWGAATEGVGTLRLREPATVGTVPASALVTDVFDRTCLFTDVTGPAVLVTPIGGTLGTVELDAALVGQPVLVNPRQVRDALDCG